MHPLFNQQLAKYHWQDLLHEAEAAQRTAHIEAVESTRSHSYSLNFLRLWYDRTRLLYRRPVVLEEAHAEAVNIEEIRPALVSTFSVMHNAGLVSEFNEQFVEKFVQTFERELEHQSRCSCAAS